MKKLITIITITLLITSILLLCPTVYAQSDQTEHNSDTISTTAAETDLDDISEETAVVTTAIILCIIGGIVVSMIIIANMKKPKARG